MVSVRENSKLVSVKQQELTQVREELQNILSVLLTFFAVQSMVVVLFVVAIAVDFPSFV